VSAEPETRMQELLDRIGGTEVESASTGVECCQAVRASSYSVIVANFPLPDCTPDELLVEIKRLDPSACVLIRDAASGLLGAIRLTDAGAAHVFGADFDPDGIAQQIEGAREQRYRRELIALSSAVDRAAEPMPGWRKLLVGDSPAMNEVYRTIELVGQRRCTVLISGETGTGKEVVARAIHLSGARSRLPMVTVNCAA